LPFLPLLAYSASYRSAAAGRGRDQETQAAPTGSSIDVPSVDV
jgi:hypothetical protein